MNSTAAPIGQTLLKLGLISADQLHIALREQGRLPWQGAFAEEGPAWRPLGGATGSPG